MDVDRNRINPPFFYRGRKWKTFKEKIEYIPFLRNEILDIEKKNNIKIL